MDTESGLSSLKQAAALSLLDAPTRTHVGIKLRPWLPELLRILANNKLLKEFNFSNHELSTIQSDSYDDSLPGKKRPRDNSTDSVERVPKQIKSETVLTSSSKRKRLEQDISTLPVTPNDCFKMHRVMCVALADLYSIVPEVINQ